MGDHRATAWFRIDRAKAEAEEQLAEEKSQADAEMAVRFANLQIPADIRARAAAWGLSAWVEVVWNSAFQAGYREAMRDRTAPPAAQDGEAE